MPARASAPTGKSLETRDEPIRYEFEEAIAAYTDAEFVSAERLFRDLVERVGIPESDRQIFSVMIGKCLFAQGEYGFALRHFDAFRAVYPESPYSAGTRIISGHCAYRTGDLLAAAREYTSALGGPEDHSLIALDNLEPLVRRGLRLRELEHVLAGLVESPASAPVHFWIAERWAASGRRRDAVAQYREAGSLTEDEDFAATCAARADQLEAPGDRLLTIGVMAPLSGDFAGYGSEVEAATQMALDRWGRSAQLVLTDTRGDAVRAAWIADSLVDIGCHAIVGPLRTECIAATVTAFRAHQIVQVLPVSRRGGSDVTGLSPRLFALSVPPDRQAEHLLQNAMATDSLMRFAAFIADTPGGRAAGRAFATAALAADATVYPIEYFTPATLDFTRALRRLKRIIRDDRDEPLPTPIEVDRMERERREAERNDTLPVFDEFDEDSLLAEEEDEGYDLFLRWSVDVDGILIWADAEDILQIVPQARALGFKGRLMGNAGWSDESIARILGDETDSALFVSDEFISSDHPEWRQYASDFRGRFGRTPTWLAGRVYDAINWLVGQTDETSDPLDPLNRLSAETEFEGAGGTYRLAPDHQRDRAVVYRYVHGRPVRLTAFDE